MAWLTTLAEKVDPSNAALLVLDMVKAEPDAGPSLEVPRLREPLLNLIQLIAAGRQVGLPIVYVKNTYSEWSILENWREAWSRRPDRHPRLYTEGTRAVELLDGLEPQGEEAVVVKHYMSAFAHGPLGLMLRCRQIKSVLLTGGGVMGAVESAALDCFVRGYYLVVVNDAVVPTSGPDYEVVMQSAARGLGALVASSREIMETWTSLTERKG